MPKLSYSYFLLNKRHLPYDSFISKFSKMSWKTPRQIQSWLVSYLFNDMLIRFQYQDALYVNVHFWKFTIQLVVTARQSHEDWRILNPGSRDQTRIGRLQQKYALLVVLPPPLAASEKPSGTAIYLTVHKLLNQSFVSIHTFVLLFERISITADMLK